MNTEYVNFYDYYIMSKEEPKTDAEINEKIIKHLATGLENDDILDTFTLQNIFYVDGKFVYSSDITLPDYHGTYYNGKHPLLLLKKEFLTDSDKPLFKDRRFNTAIWLLTTSVTKRIDKMINLIQHLLQDEPNRRDESNREFIQSFFEKRTDYTEKQYEKEKAQFKKKMEETLEELKNQDNAKEYIRDIEGLLTGIPDPEPDPEPEAEAEAEADSTLWNFSSRRMNNTKKSVSKKSKSKSKKNTGIRRKGYKPVTQRRRPRGAKYLFIRNPGPKTRKINPYKNN